MDWQKRLRILQRRGVRTFGFPPLETVDRPTLTTKEAAHYLNRKEQTLRCWAITPDRAPLKPIRIGGRLAWHTKDIKRLLEVE